MSIYGRCPTCGANGIHRERRPNGMDMCENNHVYPSKDAIGSTGRTDTQLLDALQRLTDEANYTGLVIMRDSVSGRGWRLHETGQEGAVSDVRKAINEYLDSNK